MGNKVVSAQLKSILNNCICNSTFPDLQKLAQFTPLFKKHSEPLKIAVITIVPLPYSLSNIFEKIYKQPTGETCRSIFSPMLCAYREGQGCSTLLTNMVTEWKCDLIKFIGILQLTLVQPLTACRNHY